MSLDWTEALRRECNDMTRFCRELSDVEWRTPSVVLGHPPFPVAGARRHDRR
ncbi:MAG: hypothetical protein ACR2G2_03915 [Pseudonocardia sp.]